MSNPRLTVRDLVMGFGVNYPIEHIVVVPMSNGIADRVHIAFFVESGDDGLANRMHEVACPLSVKARAACLGILGDPFVAA